MWLTGLVAPRHVGSSQTRARTRVPCISRQTPNHCATREAQPHGFKYHLFADGSQICSSHSCTMWTGCMPNGYLKFNRCQTELLTHLPHKARSPLASSFQQAPPHPSAHARLKPCNLLTLPGPHPPPATSQSANSVCATFKVNPEFDHFFPWSRSMPSLACTIKKIFYSIF